VIQIVTNLLLAPLSTTEFYTLSDSLTMRFTGFDIVDQSTPLLFSCVT
jgi:hypothetical protein